jgi:thiosulfate dehydrogenase [quinone] large subunit
MPVSLAVLRAFLGVTFAYAGAQKLLDPSFLRADTPDFVGTQLRGFAQGSPIGWLLDALANAPVLVGVGVAIGELAIGLATIAGVAPRTAAAGGFVVNVALLLSATWHVHPYFLGSDSAYAVAWLAYLVGVVEHDRRARVVGGQTPPRAASVAVGRRELLRGATLAGATIVAGAAGRLLSGTPAAATLAATETGTSIATPAAPTPAPGGEDRTGAVGGGGAPTGSAGRTASGEAVAELSSIPVGGAIGFQAPDGTPAALVRLSGDEVVAYSRVCTHAGCLVGYDGSQRIPGKTNDVPG